jgi:hypothetical protein
LRLFLSILFLLIYAGNIYCQEDSTVKQADTLPERFYILHNVMRDGIVMPEIEIKEVTVFAPPQPSDKRAYRKYERLIYNIKRVYPYAYIVRTKLIQVDEELKSLPGEKERRQYLRNFEKDIFADYENDMRKMTITQGRLLIKLIDRETQNTSYVLIRDYRGRLSALFWQSIARIFGTNLKDEYDPEGEDAMIEMIINEIESGRL